MTGHDPDRPAGHFLSFCRRWRDADGDLAIARVVLGIDSSTEAAFGLDGWLYAGGMVMDELVHVDGRIVRRRAAGERQGLAQRFHFRRLPLVMPSGTDF